MSTMLTPNPPRRYAYQPITYAELRSRYYYRDGNLYYRHSVPRKRQDSVASWDSQCGKMVHVNGKSYQQAKLIWQYFHGGELPRHVIHLDGNIHNDHINNIRSVTYGEQQAHFRACRAANIGFPEPWTARVATIAQPTTGTESHCVPHCVPQEVAPPDPDTAVRSNVLRANFDLDEFAGGIMQTVAGGERRWVAVTINPQGEIVRLPATYTVAESLAQYHRAA